MNLKELRRRLRKGELKPERAAEASPKVEYGGQVLESRADVSVDLSKTAIDVRYSAFKYTKMPSGKVVLRSGRHAGIDLAEVAITDPRYVRWLANNEGIPMELRTMAAAVLSAKYGK